ncbi:MAG: DNA-formamidopyrimidine glycosylase [Chitinivibrionales bacterium]|nr:DNA-formamidopyrimidine glycosylase [Chitinivibrionales bacterium]
MPELPDVEVFREYLETTALYKPIARVEVDSSRIFNGISPQLFADKLAGRKFIASSRRGKHLFAHTDSNGVVVLHFGMTGFLKLVHNRDERPKHTRVAFGFTGGSTLAYSCTRLLGKVAYADDEASYVEQKELGPDALAIEYDHFREIVEKSRSGIKSTLMDQTRIAGLGNIYSDEIMYQAGVHPSEPARNLDHAQVKKLFSSMNRVLEVAIRHKANPDEFPSGYLLPHRNAGDHCPRCGSVVRKMSSGGRSARYCPKCQKKS